jgi:NADPH-dependent 2,4-dienoyl-CoA reductase/sulfur reductase-like enzyme
VRKDRTRLDTNDLDTKREETVMKRFELVIVGGGLAAARAIKGYRAAGGGGRIALLAREHALPYHRPPLSKRYLRGEADWTDTLVEHESFYEANDVELLLGAEAGRVDTREHVVLTNDGTRYHYAKLLLATGAVPRTLLVEGAELPGVFSLRSLDDASAIRARAAQVRDAVVVGSGFIGMETAASLTELGLDVTLVSRDVDLFAQLGSPEISEHLVTLYRERGVDVVRAEELRAFRGRSHLDTVELHSRPAVGAGLAVVGVGVQPEVSFLEGSGIAVDNGVIVDERFQTNVANVYAVGDVARFFDPLFGRRRRIEHWSNANYQGAEVGKVLAGADVRYDQVSSFFTELFGQTFRVLGELRGDTALEGSFEAGRAIVRYRDGARLFGALVTGLEDDEIDELKDAIRAAV